MKRSTTILSCVALIALRAFTGQTHAPRDEWAYVLRVIDGDTIELTNHEVIRYIGVNTPEDVDPYAPIECGALAATQANHALVGTGPVRLAYGDGTTYGRALAYVYVRGRMVNAYLVAHGYAYADPVAPNTRYASRFARLASRAAERGIGPLARCR